MSDSINRPVESACAPATTTALVSQIIEQLEHISLAEENPKTMPKDSFDADITIIGAGPGGYV
ncbi:MAG TPA: hypothetical protein PLA92_02235, partial [Fimbriimonadaceae bacterium]|nr:hypothetical protein [Fimbriimonadaceae bacterium]